MANEQQFNIGTFTFVQSKSIANIYKKSPSTLGYIIVFMAHAF